MSYPQRIMWRVQQYIAEKKVMFTQHQFVLQLRADLPLAQVVSFVPRASFFILAFQDIVRLLGERASDPRLSDMLRQHCEEEMGHDRWFLLDLARLVGAPPDLATLFGAQHAATRRAAYALWSEAMSARDDVERLCLLLTLEATSEVCSGEAQAYFKRLGVEQGLVYFSGAHTESEMDHSIFEQGMQAHIKQIELDEPAYARTRELVDRGFDAFRVMLDGLAVAISDAAAS